MIIDSLSIGGLLVTSQALRAEDGDSQIHIPAEIVPVVPPCFPDIPNPATGARANTSYNVAIVYNIAGAQAATPTTLAILPRGLYTLTTTICLRVLQLLASSGAPDAEFRLAPTSGATGGQTWHGIFAAAGSIPIIDSKTITFAINEDHSLTVVNHVTLAGNQFDCIFNAHITKHM